VSPDAIFWAAAVAFVILAGFAAYLTAAIGYWTAVLAVWTSRTIAHRTRKEKP
jgi:hypothetical protein